MCPDVPFVLAAVAKTILGADFMAAHSLLVDSASHSIPIAVFLMPISGKKSSVRSPLVAHLSVVPPPITFNSGDIKILLNAT